MTGAQCMKRVDSETALELRERGVDVVAYTPQGVVGPATADLRDELAPPGHFAKVRRFVSLLRQIRPDHVEMYIDHPYAVLPFYALATRLLGFPLVVWCRGGEILYWNTKHNAYRRLVVRVCLRLANYLLVKEAYMPARIKELGLAPVEKIIWLPNRIRVENECTLERSGRMVLFLNSPKPWRHIEVLAQAIPSVVERVPDARFWFVGARTPAEHQYILDAVRRAGAEPWVEIRPFASHVRHYYEQASIFALPADHVYVNHSLLEAMERGVPAIIANVDPKASELVEHNVSGLILPLDSGVWADNITALLCDEPRRLALAKMARCKVARDFNLDDKISDLARFYGTSVWKSTSKTPA